MRKALMAELSDAVITVPGGLGMLEEFAEVCTWTQLGLHNIPAALLNTKRCARPRSGSSPAV